MVYYYAAQYGGGKAKQTASTILSFLVIATLMYCFFISEGKRGFCGFVMVK
jgi:hypothetical protein